MQKVNVLCVFTIQLDGNKWGHVKCSNVTGRRYIATGSSVDGEDFKKSLCWKLEWNAPSLGFYTWRRCPSRMTLKASREKLCCTFAVQHKINTHNPPPTKVSSLLQNTKEAVGYDPNRGAAMSLPPQQGQQSDLGFTCTWSGWPLEPSGAFACWTSWCSCCSSTDHLLVSVFPPASSRGHREGNASCGRSGPWRCIWYLWRKDRGNVGIFSD